MFDVSVIIPCYNQGQYLDEALQSIHTATGAQAVQILIVNDGSTDAVTQQKLRELEAAGYTVLHQSNSGLPAARNAGIRAASAPVILPLDADNRLAPDGIRLPLQALAADPDLAVVYGDRQLFEGRDERVAPGPFQLQRLLLGNYIDACAAYRKSVWEALGGYDETMRTGWEDWEFWLHAAFRGYRFQYLPELLFEYRVTAGSMVQTLNRSKRKLDAIVDHIRQKHPAYFGPQYVDADITGKFRASPAGFLGKMVLKAWMPALFEKWVARGKLRRYW